MANDLTQIQNMVDPQVLAEMISAQLPQAIKYTALAPIDDTLVGRPGTTVTVPRFKYIGDATTVAEGQEIGSSTLQSSTDTFTIKKIGKGVELTDEAMLSGYGDPVGEASKQLTLSIASKIDNDIVETANQATITLPKQDFTSLDFIDAIEGALVDSTSDINFETNDNGGGVIFVNPKDITKIRKAAANNWDRYSDLGDQILVSGVMGGVLGWQFVQSRKVPVGSAIASRPGAMRLYLKRDVNPETFRDVRHKTTLINADEHYGVAIYDDSKLLVINKFDIAGGEAIAGNVHKSAKSASTATASTDSSASTSTAQAPTTGK